MKPQRSDILEEAFNNAAPAHCCAVCGAPSPPPSFPPPDDDDLGGVEYLMMRGRWLRYMGLGKGTWFRVEFDGTRIISTPMYPPGFRMLHMPTEVLREVHYTQVREHRHNPRPGRRRRVRR